MNICFFSAQYLPTVGGVERYTYNLSKKLIDKGHRVIVVTSQVENLPHFEISKEGILIYRLPVFSLMGGRFPVIKYNKVCKDIIKKFKKEKVDFSVIQTRFYTNSIFGSFYCKKNKIPNIVIEHGTAHLIQKGVLSVFGNIYEHIVFKIIHKNCKEIYGVSKACCKWLEHFNVKTDKVLYNAVDINELQNIITEKSMMDLEKHIPENTKNVIVFSGRFISEKGVIPLVKAFEKIVKTNPDNILIMCGKGILFDEIKNLNIPNVILLGEVSYEMSMACFKRANIFCLPTFSEGFATTVLEAATFKNAIITTATGGSPEIILSKEHGILLNSMQENDIYNALLYAINNPEWCVLAGENAHNELVNNFTWDKVCEKLIDITNSERVL